MLYQVTLHIPNPFERSYDAVKTHIVGSRKAARKLAASLLKPHARFETDYSARTTRAAEVTIAPCVHFVSRHMQAMGQPKEYRECIRRADLVNGIDSRETIYPTLTYVPSVGDLGYA